MKLIPFMIASLLVGLFSCSNNEDTVKNDAPVKSELPAKEKEQLDAIAKYPDSLLLRESLIQYYRVAKNYDQAIAETNKVLQMDSSIVRFWDIKAILSYENEDTVNAINAYEHALDLYPDPQFVIALGSLYAQTKNPKALVLADALLMGKKAQAEKEALFIKGLYYSFTGDKATSIKYYDKCLDLDYNFMLGYREKAISLYELGKYDAALELLSKAVTLQNNFDEGYYWMGRCLEKMNRKEEAIESYRTALQYDPEYVDAKDALAKLGVR